MFNLNSTEYHNAHRALRNNDHLLMRDPNVWGVGVGTRTQNGEDTGEIAMVVFVARKMPKTAVPSSTLLPTVIDAGGGRLVPVDVVEVGPIRQHSHTDRIRPAQPGTSIGNEVVTAGTYGALVVDSEKGCNVILSNNHVLADNNRAPIGSNVVQPGPYDGGQVPGDRIGTLTRYVKIVRENEGNNFADVAIATPRHPDDISMVPLDNVPPPTEKYPGVGLLWGGDGMSKSFFSPLKTALKLIGANLPKGGDVIDPAPGLDVQKTGRTTERTEGRIQEINATLRVYIPEIGGTAVFKDQFPTTLMSQAGDSGSVAVTLRPR